MSVSLDHYVGRAIVSINSISADNDDDFQAGVWEIVLEGDVRIVNFDPEYEVPDDALIGMTLNKVAISKDETCVYFGTADNPQASRMFLNPQEYGIDDPGREDTEGVVRPQAPDYRNLQVPPHPDERVAEGPSGDAQEVAEGTSEAEGGTEQGDDD